MWNWKSGFLWLILFLLATVCFCFLPRAVCAKTEIYVNPLEYFIHEDGKKVSLSCGFDQLGKKLAFGMNVKHRLLQDYEYTDFGSYLAIKTGKTYGKCNYRYDDSRVEYSGGVDVGRVFGPKFNGSIGYCISYITQVDNMLAIKLNLPLGKKLKYKFHCRSAFTPQRSFEWWQQISYKVPLFKVELLKFSSELQVNYQWDRQFKFTEKELTTIIIFTKE